MEKKCVLYERNCTDCGECNICDLNPSKTCDNCGKCIDSGDDYNIIDVDLIAEESDMPLNYTDDFIGETIDDDYDDFSEDDFDEPPYLDDEEYPDDEDDKSLKDLYGDLFGDL